MSALHKWCFSMTCKQPQPVPWNRLLNLSILIIQYNTIAISNTEADGQYIFLWWCGAMLFPYDFIFQQWLRLMWQSVDQPTVYSILPVACSLQLRWSFYNILHLCVTAAVQSADPEATRDAGAVRGTCYLWSLSLSLTGIIPIANNYGIQSSQLVRSPISYIL